MNYKQNVLSAIKNIRMDTKMCNKLSSYKILKYNHVSYNIIL